MQGRFVFVFVAALLLSLTGFAQGLPENGGNGFQPSVTVANAAGDAGLEVPRWEIGGGFTTLVVPNDTRAGFGFRGVRNLNRSFSVEGEFNWSLGNTLFRVEGGHMLEGLFGVKAGLREIGRAHV